MSSILNEAERLSKYGGRIDLVQKVTDHKGFSAVNLFCLLPNSFSITYKLAKPQSNLEPLSKESKELIKKYIDELNNNNLPKEADFLEIPDFKQFDGNPSLNVYVSDIPIEKIPHLKTCLKQIENVLK